MSHASPSPASLSLRKTFAALQYPNYRLWFSGQLISIIGSWMQSTAQGFLVYQLTGSAAYLGYVSFASGIPSWLFMLYGGVIADRLSKRTLMVITQTIMMVLAFVLAGLVLSGLIQPWHIVLLAFLLGIANAFDAPARQAFTVELVERKDLTNAIAMNATLFNSGAVVGPAVAGIVYAWVGPTWCFAINGVSFLAVIAALLMMNLPPLVKQTVQTSAFKQLKEGLSFAVSNRTILTLIMTVGVVSTFGMGLVTLLPAWSVDVLNGDVRTNGALQSARGLGALAGALMIATVSHLNIRGKLVTFGTFFMPVMFILFSITRWLPMSMILLLGAGWGTMMIINSCNALVQSQVPDHLRGRIMGFYTLIFMGSMPIGALLAGTAAELTNAPITVLLFPLMILGFALFLFLRRPEIRTLG